MEAPQFGESESVSQSTETPVREGGDEDDLFGVTVKPEPEEQTEVDSTEFITGELCYRRHGSDSEEHGPHDDDDNKSLRKRHYVSDSTSQSEREEDAGRRKRHFMATHTDNVDGESSGEECETPQQKQRKTGFRTPEATEEGTDAAIMKRLHCLERRQEVLIGSVETLSLQLLDVKNLVSGLYDILDKTETKVEVLPEDVDLPLSSLEALDDLELRLSTSEGLTTTLVLYLGQIGGVDTRETVRRTMATVFGKEIQKKIVLTRSEGKRSFENLNLKRIIYRAVRKNPLTANATDSEIREIIKKWLHTAGDRNGGRGERARKKMNNSIVIQEIPDQSFLI